MLKARFSDATSGVVVSLYTGLCFLSLKIQRKAGEDFTFVGEAGERARGKQTRTMNARSSPVIVQDCLPKVYLHHETSFFFCCLEGRK